MVTRTRRRGRRPLLLALLAVGTVAVAAGLVLFQPWKLVVDDVVNEAAPPGLAELATPAPGAPGPGARAPGAAAATRSPATRAPATRAPGAGAPGAAAAGAAAAGAGAAGAGAPGAGAPAAGSGTPAPSAGLPTPVATTPSARLLARGTFLSHEHTTTGTVRVVALADGRRVLRIDDLDTSNGPDLQVWITDAPVLPGRAGWFVFDDGEYVELGRLKGNQGSQNYEIPASVDLSRLRSLSIWCDRFNVSFGAAELRRP